MNLSIKEKNSYRTLFLFFCIISLLLHFKSFSTTHNEGDEVVYLTLAKEMNWNLSHYTTMDDKRVSQFPSDTYRAPLFHHPPLYPLILKIGYGLKNPVLFGLIFQNISYMLLIFFVCRVLYLFNFPSNYAPFVLSAVVLCPVLLFSTSKLHLDGIFAIYFFCGVSLFIEALDTSSIRKSLISGLLLSIAFNIKYTALATIPILLFIQIFYLYKNEAFNGKPYYAHFKWKDWKWLIYMMLPVFFIGGQHYLRFYLIYDTLSTSFISEITYRHLSYNDFIRSLIKRTRLDMLCYLLAVFPILIFVISPPFIKYLKKSFIKKRWEFLYIVIFLYLFVIIFIFQYKVMRYFPPVFPFFYIGMALMFKEISLRSQKFFIILFFFSLFLMVTTGYKNIIIAPVNAKIVPSLIDFVPFLRHYYL